MIRTDNESARRELHLKGLRKVLPVRVRPDWCVLWIGDSRCTGGRYANTAIRELPYRLVVARGAYGGGGPILPGEGSEPSESAISFVSSYSSSPSDGGTPGNLAIRALMAERYNEDMVVGGQGLC